jgi:acetolactate synthase-1/3 small subunit
MAMVSNGMLETRHTVSLQVENRAGVLARVANLFAARGYNIDSLTVGETEDPTVSKMTIVVGGEEVILEQIMKQLNKMIDVIRVQDMTGASFVERELLLIKVSSGPQMRFEVLQIAEIFRANIVDVSPQTATLEVTGNRNKIDAVISMLRPFGIKEMAISGRVAMVREMRARTDGRLTSAPRPKRGPGYGAEAPA